MTLTQKTIAAATAAIIASSSFALADGHAFDANAARLDATLDTNGDGEVSDDEIIEGNMDIFDTDGNGSIDADERGVAEEMLMSSTDTIDTGMQTAAAESAITTEFNVNAARIDTMLDTNGDGEVTDAEIIDGNAMLFDTDGNGSIDADERGVAEQLLQEGGVIDVAAFSAAGAVDNGVVTTFDAESARLDASLDTNGDGMVSNDEIIDGNMAVFDADGNGAIDADERGVAEEVLMNS